MTATLTETTTGRVRAISHKGRRITLLDFSGITDAALGQAVTREAMEFIARAKPDGTMLTLTDVRNTMYKRETIERFKKLTAHNKPYVKAGAVVNQSPLHRAAISMVGLFSRRKIEAFETREAAMDWLVAQK